MIYENLVALSFYNLCWSCIKYERPWESVSWSDTSSVIYLKWCGISTSSGSQGSSAGEILVSPVRK